MALLSLSDHLACFRIERGKQAGCAVTRIVVRAALDLAGSHGQQRGRTVQCLYLALLGAKHKAGRRRTEGLGRSVIHHL